MFGISWIAYALLLVGFGTIAFALLAPQRTAGSDLDEMLDAEVPLDTPSVDELVSTPPPMLWPSLIDGSQTELSLEARLRLIADLGSLCEGWCGPVLVSAYLEEEEDVAREAILGALRDACYRECDDVLEAALHSLRLTERVLAVELADAIDARPALSAALTDSDLAVASAAVYALRKRLNGSLLAHVELHVSAERAAQLLDTIRVLT